MQKQRQDSVNPVLVLFIHLQRPRRDGDGFDDTLDFPSEKRAKEANEAGVDVKVKEEKDDEMQTADDQEGGDVVTQGNIAFTIERKHNGSCCRTDIKGIV